MTHLPAKLRQLVILRSGGRCEYCHLSQAGQEATFHIDHIIPVASGGQAVAENLALACVSCSLRKGARQTAIDPDTGLETLSTILDVISGPNILHGVLCDCAD